MASDRNTTRFSRRATHRVLVALCLVARFGTVCSAELSDETWQLDTYIDLGGSTTYIVRDGKTTTLPAVSAELGADLWSADAPYKGGVFASYERESRSDGDDTLVIGGWAKYRFRRWEIVTTAAFVEPGSSGSFWMHASKLRFRPKPGHKLSLEALNRVGDNRRPKYQLAYSISLPRNVSLKVGVGIGSDRMFDFAGNAQVVWSLY